MNQRRGGPWPLWIVLIVAAGVCFASIAAAPGKKPVDSSKKIVAPKPAAGMTVTTVTTTTTTATVGTSSTVVTMTVTSNLTAAKKAKPPSKLPANAVQYLPILMAEFKEYWPTMAMKSAVAAQIEQETCISLKHKKCWNPTAELKTTREYGFGFGQTTVAYKEDGTERFNNFEEMKKLDKKLASWKWDQRFDPAMQLRTILVQNKNLYLKVNKWETKTNLDTMAFMFCAYNGGLGGLMKDRQLCRATEGCDETQWFGHVEKNSFKSKIKLHGYGQSFFEINRGYVQNVIHVRREKYEPHTEYYLNVSPDLNPVVTDLPKAPASRDR